MFFIRFILKQIYKIFFSIYEYKYYYTTNYSLLNLKFKIFSYLLNYKPKKVFDIKLSNREKVHYNDLSKIIYKNFKKKKINFFNFGAGNTYLDYFLNKKFNDINHIIIEPKYSKKYYKNIKNILYYKDLREIKKPYYKIDIFYGSHIFNILPNIQYNLNFLKKITRKNSIIYLEFPIYDSNHKNIKNKMIDQLFASYFFKDNIEKFFIKKLNAKLLKKKILISKKNYTKLLILILKKI